VTVRIIVRVADYAETSRESDHRHLFKTVDIESPDLEKLLRLDYSRRMYAEVIGAELLEKEQQ
jgi:hypothetical protein